MHARYSASAMASDTVIDVLRGELERLFELDDLKRLSSDVLGFDPERVGSTGSKSAFARALVGYCADQEAIEALVDAILLSSEQADARLRSVIKSLPNGELRPGTRVGAMRVVKKIGEGGLSVVYLAEGEGQGAPAQHAALKVIRPQFARDRAAVQRFTAVSRIMRSLTSPSLASVLAVGELEDARPWVAATYMTGQTLAQRIKRSRALHVSEARPIFAGVLSGLAALHERGLLHGDIKAENVFLKRASGHELTGVLVDAGTDRLLGLGRLATTSAFVPVLGSAKAIAPEQARGLEPDARSDLYQLGTLIYETLAGRPPFLGDSPMDVIAQHLRATPEPPSAHAPSGWVSPALDEFVLRALAKDPQQRFATTTEFGEELERAVRKPAVQRPFDAEAFELLHRVLLERPGDASLADRLERLAEQSAELGRAAAVFQEAAAATSERETRVALLLRAARLYDTELRDTARAQQVYQQVLEIEPDSDAALLGLESIKRQSGDYEGLIGVLLDRVERKTEPAWRKPLLFEVASLYEKELRDPEHAFVAWSHALIADPTDAETMRQIERLAGTDQTRWGDVLQALTDATATMQAALFGGEQSRENVARRKLEQAQAKLQECQTELTSALTFRNQELAAERTRAREQLRTLEEELDKHRQELTTLNARLAAAEQQMETQRPITDAAQEAAKQARSAAHERVQAFEQMEESLVGAAQEGDAQKELAALGSDAEALVLAAEQAEIAADAAVTQLDAVRVQLEREQQAVDAYRPLLAETEQAIADQRAVVSAAPASASYTEDEQIRLNTAERAVALARGEVDALERRDSAELAAQRERDLAVLVHAQVTMGRWYVERLHRPDLAAACYSQALALDDRSDAAYTALAEMQRSAEAWTELSTTLLRHADRVSNPVRSRQYRTEAAAVLSQRLNDAAQARAQLERVLEQEPDHPQAQRMLEEILREQHDWPAYAARLASRLQAAPEAERHALQLLLAELHENELGDAENAIRHYRGVLAAHPRELRALKGLERLYARGDNFEGLLESLSAQIELAPTPKQRIALLERVGGLLEEEFVDHERAAKRFEEILAVDGGHEGASTALARIYRHLRRFDELVQTLLRHAGITSEPARKIELLLSAGRVLTADLNDSGRAVEVYESVLALDDRCAEALNELARLKTSSGDRTAALAALERLAEQEQDPARVAQLWVRAGKLLQEGGEVDGAIVRYKRALDADRHINDAAQALREIYAQRGDAHGAAQMLLLAAENESGERARAALLAELGNLYRDQLEQRTEARATFERALSLDRTSSVAAAGLMRLAYEDQRWSDVATHFALLEPRLGELSPERAAELCEAAADAYRRLGQTARVVSATGRASELIPANLTYAEAYADAVLANGEPARAAQLYQSMLEQFESQLAEPDRLRLLRARGHAQLQSQDHAGAVDTLGSILTHAPEDVASLEALTRAHEQTENWEEVINLLQLRARSTSDDDERFELLVKTADVFLDRIQDRDAAAQTYAMALDIKPANRNLLTKLMTIYSDAQDWPRVIEVILRIAEMVKEPVQFAKYYNTAATIAHKQLGRFDEAATYYQESLSKLPAEEGDSQFTGLVQCLTENQDWERLERAYELRISRLREAGAAASRIAAMLDECGEIVQNRLGRLGSALQLFEEALELEPDNEARRQRLTAIYTKEPKRFFERAIAAHRYYIDKDPTRVESLQAMRRIYTSARKPDEAWCLCQALRCLNTVEPDEEAFFKKYRLTRLPRLKQSITEEMWRDYVIHPVQDMALTAIFATLQPAVIASQGQNLQAFGLDDRHRIDPRAEPIAVARMLAHAADSISAPGLPMYRCAHDPGGLSFIFTAPPAIGIGEGAKAGGPQQALAFVAARHLSYYRPGHFMRQLVPTGTGLRAWLVGAIRSVSPRFPAPANMEDLVRQCTDAIQHHLSAPQRDTLRSLTQKLLDAAPELDMKAWMAGIDLTADRIGFVLSNDLKIANAVVEASPEDASSVSRRDRVRELAGYSVSEAYFELRKRIGIALG